MYSVSIRSVCVSPPLQMIPERTTESPSAAPWDCCYVSVSNSLTLPMSETVTTSDLAVILTFSTNLITELLIYTVYFSTHLITELLIYTVYILFYQAAPRTPDVYYVLFYQLDHRTPDWWCTFLQISSKNSTMFFSTSRITELPNFIYACSFLPIRSQNSEFIPVLFYLSDHILEHSEDDTKSLFAIIKVPTRWFTIVYILFSVVNVIFYLSVGP